MLSLLSGDALESTAGFIDFRVGGGTSGAGGNATLRSGGGCQGDDGANGGAIYISSGKSLSTTSGDIYVTTCPASMYRVVFFVVLEVLLLVDLGL